MSTEGVTRGRRPGFVKCLRSSSQGGPDLVVEDCGSYDRMHDRANNRSMPTSLFRWGAAAFNVALAFAAAWNAGSL